MQVEKQIRCRHCGHVLPWEATFPSFLVVIICYNPYVGGVKPAFFIVLGGPRVGGGNSNIFYFHPLIGGRFPI